MLHCEHWRLKWYCAYLVNNDGLSWNCREYRLSKITPVRISRMMIAYVFATRKHTRLARLCLNVNIAGLPCMQLYAYCLGDFNSTTQYASVVGGLHTQLLARVMIHRCNGRRVKTSRITLFVCGRCPINVTIMCCTRVNLVFGSCFGGKGTPLLLGEVK